MTSHNVEQLVQAIAAHRLSTHADSVEPVSIPDEHVAAVVAAVQQHRLSGVAVRALKEGGVSASDETESKLVSLHDETMGQTLRVEIMAVRVSELLANAGITHRILKGAALAHTVYPDPSERSFRDVDVLVRSTNIDEVVQLLTNAGATRARPELRAGYDRRFAKSVTMRLDGVEVDLHRLLCDGPFGVWTKPDDLFLISDSIGVARQSIPILDRTDNLLHACYHVALGQVEPALSNVRDIALLANADGVNGFDSERFDQSVDRWRGRAVIARAVRIVSKRLGDVLPPELSKYETITVKPEEQSALEPYLVEGTAGRFGALAPATLRALPPRDRPGYAVAVGLPDGAEPIDRLKELIGRRRK